MLGICGFKYSFDATAYTSKSSPDADVPYDHVLCSLMRFVRSLVRPAVMVHVQEPSPAGVARIAAPAVALMGSVLLTGGAAPALERDRPRNLVQCGAGRALSTASIFTGASRKKPFGDRPTTRMVSGASSGTTRFSCTLSRAHNAWTRRQTQMRPQSKNTARGCVGGSRRKRFAPCFTFRVK